MKLEDLAELVRQMRDAQTEYFRNRTDMNLSFAREWERRVDAACKEVLDRQKKLF